MPLQNARNVMAKKPRYIPDLVAPCGCTLHTDLTPVGPQVTMYPCRPDCDMVKLSMEAALAEGKEVNFTNPDGYGVL